MCCSIPLWWLLKQGLFVMVISFSKLCPQIPGLLVKFFLSNPPLTVFHTLLVIRSMRWSQGHLTHHMRAASSSSCSAVPPTTPFTLLVSSWLPQDTILFASTPTFTEMAKSAWASWGKFNFFRAYCWKSFLLLHMIWQIISFELL